MADSNPPWKSAGGDSTKIGFTNANGQKCLGHRDVKGTDHLQYAYKVECTRCGFVYGANGSDLHLRKCPQCQGGAAGIRY